MAKKNRPAPAHGARIFDPEKSPWFVPLVFIILFIATVILFADFVFSDQMLYGSDTLQAGYAFRSFYVDYFHEHFSVPQWTPANFGGMPYVEAFHGDIFYPFSALKFVMPLKRALGWTLLLHVFFAGVFMYLAARQFKLSKVPALLSGIAYMFAAYLVSMVAPGHDGKIFVTTLFPLMMLFLERGLEKKPFINFSFLGLVIGLMLLTPHPQMSYFSLWAMSFYAAFRLILLWIKKKSFLPVIRPAVLIAYAVVIGLLFSAIQFYPGYYYTTHFSPRADSKKGWDWATSWSMHEEEAMNILIPEFSGTASEKATTYYWGKNYFKDNCESVGVVPFFVALLGLFFARKKKAWFFGGLALFALLYALGGTTPVFRLFYWLIPKVKSLRAPSMIMFLFSFSVAMLAGMGLQAVLDARREKNRDNPVGDRRFDYLLFGFPGFMLLLAVLFALNGKGMINAWSWLFYSDLPSQMIRQGMSKLDLAYANLPAIQSGAWLAFLFSALAALCIWLYRSGKLGTGILVALLVVPVVDGVRFDRRFIKVVDKADFRARYEPDPMINYLSHVEGKFRVLNLANPNDNSLALFGIDNVVGYHGNQLRWYDDLLGGPALSNIRTFNARMLNLVGAHYLINPTAGKVPENWFGDKRLVLAAEFGQTKLIRNDNAFPRVFLVDTFRVFDERARIVDEVLKGSDDMRRVVYLEEQPSLVYSPDSTAADSAWIEDYAPERVTVGVAVGGNRILVLTDNYFDAWQAEIDGAPAKVLRAYGSFRAVEVPAGSREVVFSYRSQRYLTGRLITWLTGVYLLIILGAAIFWNRRKQISVEQPEQKESNP